MKRHILRIKDVNSGWRVWLRMFYSLSRMLVYETFAADLQTDERECCHLSHPQSVLKQGFFALTITDTRWRTRDQTTSHYTGPDFFKGGKEIWNWQHLQLVGRVKAFDMRWFCRTSAYLWCASGNWIAFESTSFSLATDREVVIKNAMIGFLWSDPRNGKEAKHVHTSARISLLSILSKK